MIRFIPRRYWTIIVVALTLAMSVLDGTIVNVALPTLSREFGTSPSSTIWIINAYRLTITMSLLSFSALGDIYGYKQIFLIGTTMFCSTSLFYTLSSSFVMLTAAKMLQGIGASAIMSVTAALLRIIYPPQYMGRGTGISAMIMVVSVAAGPSLADAILSIASWNWLFAINIPLGICAIITGYFLLPQNPRKDGPKRKFDKIGGILNVLTFGLPICSSEGITHHENWGMIALQVLLLLVIGTFFIRRQLRQEVPILPLDLMRIPTFALSVLSSIISFTAQLLAMISLSSYLQNITGRDEVETGLLLTPRPVVTILIAPMAGRPIEKYHPGLLGGVGIVMYTTGLLLLALLPGQPTNMDIAWRLILYGMGLSLFQTPSNSTMISTAPRSRNSGANGMQGTARLLEQALGTTFVALILSVTSATDSIPICIYVAVGFALVAVIVSCLHISQPVPMRRR